MSKARRFIPFLALLLAGAAAFSGTIWLRSAETPPWKTGKSPTALETGRTDTSNSVSPDADVPPFTFISYNVKNWLVSSQSPEKSAASKQAVIRILSTSAPDVIGLCEIGSLADAEEIRSMLKAEGFDFPHIHHTGGVDPIRHLALLSRFPIVSTEHPDPRIPGSEHSMQRGILDATLSISGAKIRFIGLHLKSKRRVAGLDEAALRIKEAGRARQHIDGILAEKNDAMLVVYGDLNDTTRSLSTRTICGTYRTPGYMTTVHMKDARGETWTHRYDPEDSYTRIDFVTVSPALTRHVKRNGTRIIDDPLWETASDHRPVLVRFE